VRAAVAAALLLASLPAGATAAGTCPPRATNLYDAEIEAACRSVAGIWPVPPAFVKAIIQRESGFQPHARSPVGAIGLMQVMPWNARRLGFTPADLWEPRQNILAGTRLLAVLLRHYQGDVISTLVAYNAGPRRPFAPVPVNAETPGYVRGVRASWRLFHRCQARNAPP